MEDPQTKSYLNMAAIIGGCLGVAAIIGAFFWRKSLETSAASSSTVGGNNLTTVLPAILLFAGFCVIVWAVLVLVVGELRSRKSYEQEDIPKKILNDKSDKSLLDPPPPPPQQ